jgi:ankyrin repeat protein
LKDHNLFRSFCLQDQRSALHLACEKGHQDIVKYLIKWGKGLDLDWQNTFGNTALHWTASEGHLRIAEILLEAGAKTDLQNRFTMKTPLHWAAEEGNLEFVQLLIRFNADLEVKHVAGYTALHEAAKYGHYDVVKTLLYHKASRDSKGMDGKTAKDLAFASEAFKVTALIDRYPERLREGAYKNRAETVVDIIISMGVAIDDADMDTGDTAMHLAAIMGHHNIINILSEYGANPNLVNNEGDMPLHLACRLGQEGLKAATKLIQVNGRMHFISQVFLGFLGV